MYNQQQKKPDIKTSLLYVKTWDFRLPPRFGMCGAAEKIDFLRYATEIKTLRLFQNCEKFQKILEFGKISENCLSKCF